MAPWEKTNKKTNKKTVFSGLVSPVSLLTLCLSFPIPNLVGYWGTKHVEQCSKSYEAEK